VTVALSDILTRILEEAEEESGRTRSRGEEEAGRVLDEARREAETIREKLRAKGEAKLRRQMSNAVSRQRLEARKEILSLKKRLLDDLFGGLPAALQNRPEGEYASLLAGLVGDDLGGHPAELEVGREDLAVFGEGFPDRVAALLADRFSGWEVAASREAGGFERGLRIRAGRLEHNLSLETLLVKSREKMEVDAARVLFSP
jgi:vacuolar-type H+-ATPase subunit E/Vma4